MALHGGHPQLGSDLGPARHPHPPGPSALWLDADGRRFDAPNFPGFDTLGTLAAIRARGDDYSWFVMSSTMAAKEIALSGSEQNPDLTGRDWRRVLERVKPGAPGPVQAFIDRGADFATAATPRELAARMSEIADADRPIDAEALERTIRERDLQLGNPFGKDAQLAAIGAARRSLPDRLIRVAPPDRMLDPRHGPLVAIRLSLLTRKTLGGIETDLAGRALGAGGEPVPGLWAAGEASGFGGGGMHGYRALERTFLGGCLFSGRAAGRSAAVAAR